MLLKDKQLPYAQDSYEAQKLGKAERLFDRARISASIAIANGGAAMANIGVYSLEGSKVSLALGIGLGVIAAAGTASAVQNERSGNQQLEAVQVKRDLS